MGPNESNDNAFGEIVFIIRKRYLWILACMILGLLAGILFSRSPRKYQADGSVRIEPGMSSMYRTSPIALATGDTSDKIASETSILQSRTLYLQLARELNLVNDAAFWGTPVTTRRSLEDPATRELLIRQMRSRIKVEHGPKDEIVNISCTTTSPVLSAKIINTLINDYVEYLFKMKYGATQRTATWLIGQLGDLKNEIESDQVTLTELQGKLGIVGLGEKDATSLSVESLDAITKASSEATIQRIIAEAKFRYLSESDPGLIENESQLLAAREGASGLGLLQTLRVNQASAAAAYARLSAQFGPNYPDVRDAKAQLDSINRQVSAEQQRIVNQAKLSYQAAAANERMTTSELSNQKSQAFKSRDDMVKYAILLHDYESHRTLYEGLVQRLREAGITSGMESGEIDIVDLADVPGIPNPPGPLTISLAGLLGGLLTGCVLALLLQFVNSRVTSPEQAESLSGLPVLAVLPHFSVTGRGAGKAAEETTNIEIFDRPTSLYAEAVQTLRTSVLISLPGGAPKFIMVTSSVPRDGKSTISRNLAAALAQHKRKVLLVDCDLRRGTLGTRILGSTFGPGLSSVLTRQIDFQDAVYKLPGTDSLYLLPAGPRPAQPAILLDSAELQQFLDRVAVEYDHVILDCPPLLGISDTVNLARHANVLLFVIREGSTHTKVLRQARFVLRSAKLTPLGAVINDVDLRSAGYGYGEGYYGYFNPEDVK